MPGLKSYWKPGSEPCHFDLRELSCYDSLKFKQLVFLARERRKTLHELEHELSVEHDGSGHS